MLILGGEAKNQKNVLPYVIYKWSTIVFMTNNYEPIVHSVINVKFKLNDIVNLIQKFR